MAITKVYIIGASGHLGPAVLTALQSCPTFQITILQRRSSRATFPYSSAPIKILPDDLPEDALLEVLNGQDALVSTMPGSAVEPHIRMANACAKAGVRRFIPADYGSVDSSDGVVAELVPLYKQKTAVREVCQQLAETHSGFSWTSLVCGHFFDYGLRSGLLGFDLKEGTAEIFDGGEKRWSTSTLARIGEAVVRVLQRDEETRNKMLYIQSFCVSQLDVMEALMKVGGRQFTASFRKSEEYVREKKHAVDGGDEGAMEGLVCVLGVTRADWEGKDGFANGLLGLEGEDLEGVVREVVLAEGRAS